MKLPRRNFSIWPRALPRCRPPRVSLGRKPIRRGRCALSKALALAQHSTSSRDSWSIAVGATGTIICHREPQWCQQQYCRRGGRAASPDGYTLLLISTANAINTALYEKLNFSFIRDIVPVASIVRVPLVMEVHPSVPAKTVPEFIAYAKANPGKINMASA